MKSVVASAVVMAALIQLAQAQDVAAGEQSFKKCLPCHSIGEGAKNKVGPILNGLDGRHSGTVPDYNYSDANKNSGITWTEANLAAYLPAPKMFIPGTKMSFVGLPMPQDVADIIAYLKQFDANGNQAGH